MVNFHPNGPAVGHVQHGQGGASIIWDTVIAAVASVFSLVMASSVEREAPELAAALRFVPAAAGLIWILRRCLGGPQQQHGHYQQPVAPVQRGWRWIPRFNGYNLGNWWNNPAPPPPVHYHHHRAPAPHQPAILHVAPQTRNNFPAVQHAPPNPLPPPVYQAPPSARQPFPAVQRTPTQQSSFPVVNRAAANPGPDGQMHVAPQSRMNQAPLTRGTNG